MKVKYSVSPSDRWSDVSVFFDNYPQAFEQLRGNFGNSDLDFFALSVRGMLEAASGRIPSELSEKHKDRSVKEWCEMANSVKDGVSRFLDFLEKTQPPYTLKQKKMTNGILKSNLEEAVLMTLKCCFTLNSLEDATKLTVYEYMMARKEAYNDAVINYNMSVSDGIAAGVRS